MTDFCPNCGYTILGKDKDFCGNCGCALSKRPKTTHMKTVGYRTPSGKIVDVPKIGYEAVTEERANKPGSYSAKCLAYSIISLSIVVISLFIGLGSLVQPLFFSSSSNGLSLESSLIIVILLHSAGVLLGIYSRLMSKKAMKYEASNKAEIIGSVLAIFGIIINLIFLLFGMISYGLLYDPNVYFAS